LKLGTIAAIGTVLKPINFGFKRSGGRAQGGISQLLPNPRRACIIIHVWRVVWYHSEQLCLSSRRGFASAHSEWHSAHSTYRQDCCKAQTANRRYCFYSEAKNQHFCPAVATRCTDSCEIWHSRGARGSAWPCKISRQSVPGVGTRPPKRL